MVADERHRDLQETQKWQARGAKKAYTKKSTTISTVISIGYDDGKKALNTLVLDFQQPRDVCGKMWNRSQLANQLSQSGLCH